MPPLLSAVGLSLPLFVYLCYRARAGSSFARALAVGQAALSTGVLSLVVLDATAMLVLRCDEACDENLLPAFRSGRWWDTSDAWQWDAQALVALSGLTAGAAAIIAIARRRHARATAAFALAVACLVGWSVLVAPIGAD